MLIIVSMSVVALRLVYILFMCINECTSILSEVSAKLGNCNIDVYIIHIYIYIYIYILYIYILCRVLYHLR